RRWRPPQRCALHQRTSALWHLPRLAGGNPDHFFRQDHVLERGPGGTPRLERESAAGMTADLGGRRRPTANRAIVAVGLKALAFDSSPPLVCDEPVATYERASDEHGRLAVSAATNRLNIGDKIRLIPGHCDPTVNLYDWYVCIRSNRVEQLWPITARGAVY